MSEQKQNPISVAVTDWAMATDRGEPVFLLGIVQWLTLVPPEEGTHLWGVVERAQSVHFDAHSLVADLLRAEAADAFVCWHGTDELHRLVDRVVAPLAGPIFGGVDDEHVPWQVARAAEALRAVGAEPRSLVYFKSVAPSLAAGRWGRWAMRLASWLEPLIPLRAGLVSLRRRRLLNRWLRTHNPASSRVVFPTAPAVMHTRINMAMALDSRRLSLADHLDRVTGIAAAGAPSGPPLTLAEAAESAMAPGKAADLPELRAMTSAWAKGDVWSVVADLRRRADAVTALLHLGMVRRTPAVLLKRLPAPDASRWEVNDRSGRAIYRYRVPVSWRPILKAMALRPPTSGDEGRS